MRTRTHPMDHYRFPIIVPQIERVCPECMELFKNVRVGPTDFAYLCPSCRGDKFVRVSESHLRGVRQLVQDALQHEDNWKSLLAQADAEQERENDRVGEWLETSPMSAERAKAVELAAESMRCIEAGRAETLERWDREADAWCYRDLKDTQESAQDRSIQ